MSARGCRRHTGGVMANDGSLSSAPGELDLVLRFVNTLDNESGVDTLSSPASATDWLRDEGWRIRVGRSQLSELVDIREALRDIAGTRGAGTDPEAIASLDAIAQRYPLVVRLSSADTLVPSTSAGIGAFIERILGLVASARIDGSWDRVKTCPNDRCRWLFYDHSRNRSRIWCTMDVCGSQAKMRAYRSRRRSSAPA